MGDIPEPDVDVTLVNLANPPCDVSWPEYQTIDIMKKWCVDNASGDNDIKNFFDKQWESFKTPNSKIRREITVSLRKGHI